LLSLGIPMFVMGDEVRRTQHGNNNAYCQDNETSWFDWSLITEHADLLRFSRMLIAQRLLRDGSAERQRATLAELISGATQAWHGIKPNQPDWSLASHSVAFSADLPNEGVTLYCVFNAYWEPLEFELPIRGNEAGGCWRRWIDTSLDAPEDIVPFQQAPAVQRRTYRVGPRSVVVLWADCAD
jgi:isoamylase